jgi:hypothetical protein
MGSEKRVLEFDTGAHDVCLNEGLKAKGGCYRVGFEAGWGIGMTVSW